MVIIIYYFASRQDFDKQTLTPRIPKHRMPFEDELIPKLCEHIFDICND